MLGRVTGGRATDLCLLTAYSTLRFKQGRAQTRIIAVRVKNAFAKYFFFCWLKLGDDESPTGLSSQYLGPVAKPHGAVRWSQASETCHVSTPFGYLSGTTEVPGVPSEAFMIPAAG